MNPDNFQNEDEKVEKTEKNEVSKPRPGTQPPPYDPTVFYGDDILTVGGESGIGGSHQPYTDVTNS